MNTACSIPGSVMLSVQLARPVTRAGSSLRHRPPPTNFSGAWVTCVPPLGRCVLNQLVPMLLDELDGLPDVLVARAAAQVPFQAFPYLPLRRVRILLQEADGGHDHAGRAVAALETVRLVESLLHRMPHTVLRDAPDGGDLVPVGLHRKDRARLDRLPVDVDRAGPATGRIAPRVHAPDPEVLPEMMEQQQSRFHLGHVGVPVHRHLDPTQPSLLSLKWTQRLYDSSKNYVLPAFPRPLSTYLHTPHCSPMFRGFCSPYPFLVESAGSLARQVFLCTLPIERHRQPQALRRGCRISALSAELRTLLMKGTFGSGTYVRRVGAFCGTEALPGADRAPRSLRPRARQRPRPHPAGLLRRQRER